MTDKTMVITLTLPGDADTAELFKDFPLRALYVRDDIPNEQLIDKDRMRELAGCMGVAIYRKHMDSEYPHRVRKLGNPL